MSKNKGSIISGISDDYLNKIVDLVVWKLSTDWSCRLFFIIMPSLYLWTSALLSENRHFTLTVTDFWTDLSNGKLLNFISDFALIPHQNPHVNDEVKANISWSQVRSIETKWNNQDSIGEKLHSAINRITISQLTTVAGQMMKHYFSFIKIFQGFRCDANQPLICRMYLYAYSLCITFALVNIV